MTHEEKTWRTLSAYFREARRRREKKARKLRLAVLRHDREGELPEERKLAFRLRGLDRIRGLDLRRSK